MAGPNKTEVKRRKTKKKSYSSSKKGGTKAQRKETYTSEASAEPKTPSQSSKPSQKRSRSKSPAPTPSSSAKRRRRQTIVAPVDHSFELASLVIRACPVDHWWRVSPNYAEKDDVCVGSQQTWADVLPVFIEADLLRTKSIDGIKYELNYNSARWDMMKEELDEKHGIVMHRSAYRQKTKRFGRVGTQ